MTGRDYREFGNGVEWQAEGQTGEGHTLATGTPMSIDVWIAAVRLSQTLAPTSILYRWHRHGLAKNCQCDQ